MRAPRIIVRAALVCGATGIALGVWAAAEDTAARADDSLGLLPAAVDLTGDLADTPVRTVEQAPRRAAKLTQAAPAPVRTAAAPAEQLANTAVEPVQPSTRTPRLAAAPPRGLRAPATKPPAEAVPAVALLAGAAPTTVTVDPARAADRPAAVAYTLPCDGDSGVPSRDGTQCTPGGQSNTPGLAQVKPPTKTGADQLAATTPTDPATPALRLLGELLPRSDLPAGRTTHVDPRPA